MICIRCENCGESFPETGFPYRCWKCGGTFGFSELPNLGEKDPTKPGIWQYQDSFGIFRDSPVISLGEGNTPLVTVDQFDKSVGYKLEYLNPTGSFKDRGTAVLMSALVERGMNAAIEDSSGNAGASFSAYAARAGLKGKVYVPDYASAAKRKQIGAYGSEVVRVLGKRSNASRVVKKAADQGEIYASHAHLPHGLLGFASIAYELFDQLGRAPGSIVTPVGQGSLYLGIGYGFQLLKNARIIERLPVMVGVQAMACAPLWAMFTQGPAGFQWVTEGETLAEGIRIKHPHRGDAVLRMAENTQGAFVVVDEDQIQEGMERLYGLGFFVEPTSAVVWHGLKQVFGYIPEPIIVILTGSGYKNN